MDLTFLTMRRVLVFFKNKADASISHSTVIFREYSKKNSVEMLQYCKNIYKAVGKVYKILQESCNILLIHYKCIIAALLIFNCNVRIVIFHIIFFSINYPENKASTYRHPLTKNRNSILN